MAMKAMDNAGKVLTTGVWGWVIVKCTGYLAGKDTKAVFRIAVDWAIGDEIGEWILRGALVVAIAGCALKNWTRKKALREKDDHVRALEAKLDPKRTSSGLPSGE